MKTSFHHEIRANRCRNIHKSQTECRLTASNDVFIREYGRQAINKEAAICQIRIFIEKVDFISNVFICYVCSLFVIYA